MQLRKLIIRTLASVVLLLSGTAAADAQIYGKLNLLYACAGVINPQVEFRLSEHSAFQTEMVVSPWKQIGNGRHMVFGIFINEYRYFFGERTKGLYAGVSLGVQVFDMSKPEFLNGRFDFQNRYCKGYGFMAGAVVGYEHRFRERWIVDAFLGFGYFLSWYNGYTPDGELQMHPHGHEWDPFNGSAEWLPTKAGVSVGYRLFDPHKRKN